MTSFIWLYLCPLNAKLMPKSIHCMKNKLVYLLSTIDNSYSVSQKISLIHEMCCQDDSSFWFVFNQKVPNSSSRVRVYASCWFIKNYNPTQNVLCRKWIFALLLLTLIHQQRHKQCSASSAYHQTDFCSIHPSCEVSPGHWSSGHSPASCPPWLCFSIPSAGSRTTNVQKQ